MFGLEKYDDIHYGIRYLIALKSGSTNVPLQKWN